MIAKPIDDPMTIRFPPLARFAAYSMFLFLAICWIYLPFFFIFPAEKSWMEWAALCSGVAIQLGASVWWIHYYFSRLVFCAELGDHFRCQTWSGEFTFPWTELARFVLREDTSPLPGLRIISVMLTDGTRLSIWMRPAQAEAALQLVRTKPWAREWPGAPLGFGIALVVISVGLLALSIGVIAGYWSIMRHLGPVPEPVPILTSEIIAAVGGPLLGLAAVGFGVYHVIYCPAFYRSAVMRSSEVQGSTIWEKIKRWFSSPE